MAWWSVLAFELPRPPPRGFLSMGGQGLSLINEMYDNVISLIE